MLISFRDNAKLNNVCLYVLVITVLIGPMVYLGVASLYHFYVAGMLLLILYKGIYTGMLRTDIMLFLFLWLLEAGISLLWAPDKAEALQYVYYIFLITSVCLLFHYFIDRNNLEQFVHFMVIVLFVCNLIAFWEMCTGNHLIRKALPNLSIAWKLKYVPRGFATNPNEFATYLVQVVPFSFACAFFSKKSMRIISFFNIVLSFVAVCATESRTQILLMLIMCFLFLLVCRKKEIIEIAVFAGLLAVALFFVYPEFNNLIDGALQSIKGESLVAEALSEGTSLDVRINLLKNGGYILLDTFGFGIGAGCHRTVMSAYSSMYFNTHRVLVMHNLVGELFVDYGIFIGSLFLAVIVKSCCSLYRIYKTNENHNIQMLAIMLAFSLGGFILCGISSSSIIQSPSLWMTFCFTSAFIKCCAKRNSET